MNATSLKLGSKALHRTLHRTCNTRFNKNNTYYIRRYLKINKTLSTPIFISSGHMYFVIVFIYRSPVK